MRLPLALCVLAIPIQNRSKAAAAHPRYFLYGSYAGGVRRTPFKTRDRRACIHLKITRRRVCEKIGGRPLCQVIEPRARRPRAHISHIRSIGKGAKSAAALFSHLSLSPTSGGTHFGLLNFIVRPRPAYPRAHFEGAA